MSNSNKKSKRDVDTHIRKKFDDDNNLTYECSYTKENQKHGLEINHINDLALVWNKGVLDFSVPGNRDTIRNLIRDTLCKDVIPKTEELVLELQIATMEHLGMNLNPNDPNHIKVISKEDVKIINSKIEKLAKRGIVITDVFKDGDKISTQIREKEETFCSDDSVKHFLIYLPVFLQVDEINIIVDFINKKVYTNSEMIYESLIKESEEVDSMLSNFEFSEERMYVSWHKVAKKIANVEN
jgi:hypothetical protein